MASLPESPQSPPKRPRLSLQIKAISSGPTGRTSRSVAALVDPKDHANFNALSNVYSSAIDRAAPSAVEPVTAIKTLGQPLLRLQTSDFTQKKYAVTPFTATLPETPLTAQPMSPAVAMEMIAFPSTMTATPPLSAGPSDSAVSGAFAFSPRDIANARALNFRAGAVSSPRTPARRCVAPNNPLAAKPLPYSHQRGIHSILRNSPLPPRTATTPISPRRQSARLAEKAARRVGYNNPLTQTITTNRYTRSHIDLLCEEASPYSPANPAEDPEVVLDLAMAYTGDETRDGGQTPGPFEEMRRRMAGLATSTPTSAGGSLSAGGIRKRKKKEKKRRWVWTIGREEEEGDQGELGGAMAAIKAAEANGAITAAIASTSSVSVSVPTLAVPIAAPRAMAKPAMPPQLKVSIAIAGANVAPPEIITPSIESDNMSEHMMMDVEMSDSCSVVSTTDESESGYGSNYENEGDVTARVMGHGRGIFPTGRGLTPGEMDVDMVTPTVPRKSPNKRLGSVRLMSEGPETRSGTRDDTPIPAELIAS